MGIVHVLPLLLLAFIAGYWIALIQAKRVMLKEIRVALDALQREEEARLQ